MTSDENLSHTSVLVPLALLELTDTCVPQPKLAPSWLPLNPNGAESMSRVAERKIRLSLRGRKDKSFSSLTTQTLSLGWKLDQKWE